MKTAIINNQRFLFLKNSKDHFYQWPNMILKVDDILNQSMKLKKASTSSFLLMKIDENNNFKEYLCGFNVFGHEILPENYSLNDFKINLEHDEKIDFEQLELNQLLDVLKFIEHGKGEKHFLIEIEYLLEKESKLEFKCKVYKIMM